MAWTTERVEQLKALWKEGHSASQVASMIGGVSRNAVIGKIHRLGMADRATTKSINASRKTRMKRRNRVVNNTVNVVGNTALKVETYSQEVAVEGSIKTDSGGDFNEFVPTHLRKSLLQLSEHTCKWPIGHPGDDDFYFCGRPKDLSSPYCKHHSARAFQQIERKSSGAKGK